jgi:vitamin B12 transporter
MLFMCAGSLYAPDESHSQQAVDLEKITVTSRRTPIDLGESIDNVTVISDEQIKYLPARDLSEVLSYVPGIDIEPRQGFGRGASVTIQGSDSRQVRVMIDGIPFNNQASGQADLSKFPIENIARIEVIKGPSSSIWGSALGGVINVITKDTGTTTIPHGNITTSFAEFRTRRHSGDVSGKAGPFGYYFSSSYMESGGHGPRDDVLEKNTFGKISYAFEQIGNVTASFGYTGADANSGQFPDGTWQSQPYLSRYGKMGWQKDFGSADLSIDLKHVRQDMTLKSFLTVADEEPLFIIRTRDAFYQCSINSTIRPRGKDLLVLGADFDWHILKSDYLSQAKNIKLEAPYFNYTWIRAPWDLNFGFRFDHNSEFGKQLSPSLGVLYHPGNTPDTSIRFQVSRAFNAPPLLWKHYELTLSGITTNPDIKPERAWVYELGLESKCLQNAWVKLSLYRSDVWDALNLATNGSGEFFMKNFEKFIRQGVEFQSRVNITNELSFLGAAAFNDIKDRATKKIVTGGGRPRQSLSLGIDYRNKRGLNFYLRGHFDRWNEPPEAAPNDRKMLCDANISQQFKNTAFFLNIYNIANSKYWADFFFPVPERYFEGGITCKW